MDGPKVTRTAGRAHPRMTMAGPTMAGLAAEAVPQARVARAALDLASPVRARAVTTTSGVHPMMMKAGKEALGPKATKTGGRDLKTTTPGPAEEAALASLGRAVAALASQERAPAVAAATGAAETREMTGMEATTTNGPVEAAAAALPESQARVVVAAQAAATGAPVTTTNGAAVVPPPLVNPASPVQARAASPAVPAMNGRTTGGMESRLPRAS